jgi:hypothetical protein
VSGRIDRRLAVLKTTPVRLTFQACGQGLVADGRGWEALPAPGVHVGADAATGAAVGGVGGVLSRRRRAEAAAVTPGRHLRWQGRLNEWSIPCRPRRGRMRIHVPRTRHVQHRCARPPCYAPARRCFGRRCLYIDISTHLHSAAVGSGGLRGP